MKGILIFAAVMLLTCGLFAQCAEKPEEKIGGYKKNNNINNSSITGFGKTNAKVIDAKLDQLAAVIQRAYPQPKGCSVNWSPMPFEHHNISSGRPSYYSIWYVQAYFCNSQTKKLGLNETFLMPILTVNGIDNHLFEKAGDAQQKINGKVAFTLPPLAEKTIPGGILCRQDGYYNNSTPGVKHTAGAYLAVLYPSGKNPFIPINREEYINFLMSQAREEFAKSPITKYEDLPDKSLFTRDTWNNRVKIQQSERDAVIELLAKHLAKMTAAQKNLPACITDFSLNGHITNHYTYFTTHLQNNRDPFTTPDKGYQVVSINPAFFDSKTAATVPQLISFSWQFKTARTEFSAFYEAMLNKLDFNSLASFLGK